MKKGGREMLSGQRSAICHRPNNFSSVGIFDLPSRDSEKVLKNSKR